IQVGQNAQYSLDGGATTLYSTSNTVSDAIPGVTMTFTGTTTTPAQFTVSQDIDSAVNAVKKFVDAYNAAMAAIDSDTAYDSDKKQASVLTGDSSVMMLQQALRSMIVSPAVNVASGYKTLGDIGISFGAYGSKVGTTDTLQVDETKLRAALQNNGTGVFDLLGAGSSATLTTPGDIASIFGAPSNPPDSGRYEISSDGAGNFTVTFIDQSSVTRWTKTGTIQAGQSDVTLIPGLTLTAASSFTGATTTITVTRRDGVLAAFDRYLKGTLDSADGLFKIQDQSADDQIKRLDDDISRMQDRLDQRQATLEAQFTAMETFLAQLQAQTGGALAQLASMSAGASLLGS
ncbi:MAG: flagellar filament capping protein FliD, partial [Thermomicrobiaceae bacterium]|nr:flagellar filament capping protein FliD [Thermomicrobiaceae bacterium]